MQLLMIMIGPIDVHVTIMIPTTTTQTTTTIKVKKTLFKYQRTSKELVKKIPTWIVS